MATATLESLLHDLDEAIRPATCCEAAVCQTCEVLRAFADAAAALPERLLEPGQGRYARHLIHQQCDDGYCVVAMVWGPGQGTPVHDHGGVWCVEGCVRGRLEITSYRMLGSAGGDMVRMTREKCVAVAPGSVGCLIPPFEHHKIHNPYDEVAVTLHVYGKELRNCTRYVEAGDDLFRTECVPLCYTSQPV